MRQQTKKKGPGDPIVFRIKNDEDPEFIDFINKQGNITEMMRMAIQVLRYFGDEDYSSLIPTKRSKEYIEHFILQGINRDYAHSNIVTNVNTIPVPERILPLNKVSENVPPVISESTQVTMTKDLEAPEAKESTLREEAVLDVNEIKVEKVEHLEVIQEIQPPEPTTEALDMSHSENISNSVIEEEVKEQTEEKVESLEEVKDKNSEKQSEKQKRKEAAKKNWAQMY